VPPDHCTELSSRESEGRSDHKEAAEPQIVESFVLTPGCIDNRLGSRENAASLRRKWRGQIDRVKAEPVAVRMRASPRPEVPRHQHPPAMVRRPPLGLEPESGNHLTQ
jgi:hypothetical protein